MDFDIIKMRNTGARDKKKRSMAASRVGRQATKTKDYNVAFISSSSRKEIWGSCCVRCSSLATFETAVASKSGTAFLSCP